MAKVDNPNERVLGNHNLIVTSEINENMLIATFSSSDASVGLIVNDNGEEVASFDREYHYEDTITFPKVVSGDNRYVFYCWQTHTANYSDTDTPTITENTTYTALFRRYGGGGGGGAGGDDIG